MYCISNLDILSKFKDFFHFVHNNLLDFKHLFMKIFIFIYKKRIHKV